jgi:hypothetical protein
VLTIAAASNTVCIACTASDSVTGLAGLDIQSSLKTVLGTTTVNGDATIRADQEIYLNGDTTVAGNLALLADANNDGVGLAAQLSGKQLQVGGTLTTQPIALSSIATAALCTSPTGLPQMPNTPPTPQPPQPGVASPSGQAAMVTPNEVTVAVQESNNYALATQDAMLHNEPQIAYLGNNCPSTIDSHNSHEQCRMDASMLDFLGTFLIDNQIPNSGTRR